MMQSEIEMLEGQEVLAKTLDAWGKLISGRFNPGTKLIGNILTDQ